MVLFPTEDDHQSSLLLPRTPRKKREKEEEGKREDSYTPDSATQKTLYFVFHTSSLGLVASSVT
jgi:hypothetical protein